MTRRLVPVKRMIEDAENQGLDLDELFVDPDDVVEIEEEPEED